MKEKEWWSCKTAKANYLVKHTHTHTVDIQKLQKLPQRDGTKLAAKHWIAWLKCSWEHWMRW